ncbi:hypothetical protein RI129_007598 [Pyrocoelia pectoralis]|uniref:Protein adenylyltransferase Fic n=1 Tax=Pyrocoelia pectoralis TaxID=417401 RepID=A0AAN7VBG2_9COLE
MKITFVIISILIGIICVLTVWLQYFYIQSLYLKTSVGSATPFPIFEDMVASEMIKNVVDRYNKSETYILGISNLLNNAVSKGSTTFRNHSLVTHTEVQHLLKAALAFKLSGKVDKAMKLLEHVASIAPQNPDLLNQYGEYIEHTHNDIVAADVLYYKALTYSPNHKGALLNRKRSANLVDKFDLELFKLIDKKRDLLQEKQKTNTFYKAMKRKAYYLHIYHTVAIEGNTLTLDQLVSLLDTGQAVEGKSLLEHNEVLGVELAMNYVKLLTRCATISADEILAIHRRVLGHVDPIGSGMLRGEQVFVGSHVPPAPEYVPALLEDYTTWLNSEEAQSLHPVRYAALAHFKLVDIHPFTDGNGRTSRLIMNLVLLRTGFPPILIFKYQREKYHESLNLADKGDVRPFVRFIAQCMENSLNFYLSNMEYRTGITHIFHKVPSID